MSRRHTCQPLERHCAPLSALPSWHAAALVVGAIVVAVMAMVVPGILFGGARAAPIATGLSGIGLAVAGYVLLARVARVPAAAVFLDRPTARTLGWGVIGLGLGGSVPVMVAVLSEGRFVFEASSPAMVATGILASLVLGGWAGAVEEMLLRGYVLATVGARWHWPGAVALSAGVFGLLHHGAAETVPGQVLYVAVTTTAGATFAAVTLRSRTVWDAVAIHAAWNAAFGPFAIGFGTVDGGSTSLIRYVPIPDHPLLGADIVAPTESPVVGILFAALGAIVLISQGGLPTRD